MSANAKPNGRDDGEIEVKVVGNHDYYGAVIREVRIGPRRELTVCIETWPQEKTTSGRGVLVTIRFGAISNYAEVQRFFVEIPTDGLHYLRESNESKKSRRVVEMEFDRTGDRFKIVARHVSAING